MKVFNVQTLIFAVLLAFITQPVLAQPTFQVWSPDWDYAGDYAEDQDTWFVDDSSFELWVIGSYHPEVYLEQVTLLISVPDGETGTITITPLDGTAVPVYDGFYTDTTFLPDPTLNNHYPLHDDVSDFIVYNIDPFVDVGDPIFDYNADGGTITATGSTGQVNEYLIEISGYTSVHFDVYGLALKDFDDDTWELNPGSHDVTYIPVPGAVFLGGIGVCLVGWLRRRRTL